MARTSEIFSTRALTGQWRILMWSSLETLMSFEKAVARITGEAVMELMAQVRPRVKDYLGIALGGSSHLKINLVLSAIFHSPVLNNYKFKHQFWARYNAIRRNMTTSKCWMWPPSSMRKNASPLWISPRKDVLEDPAAIPGSL
jgi:hypothetical protein